MPWRSTVTPSAGVSRRAAPGGHAVTTVCSTPWAASARDSCAVWFCMPPIGSKRAPAPVRTSSGGSKTEHSRRTRGGQFVEGARPVPTAARPPGADSGSFADGCPAAVAAGGTSVGVTPLDAVDSIAVLRARTGLGDLLCGVPALRALRARLPHARITLVTYAEMAPVAERMRAYVDEFVPFPGWPGIP